MNTTKDCWFKDTSKSGPYNNKDKKGEGKGKGKSGVTKVTNPREVKEPKESKEPKELKKPKELKESKESTVTPTKGTTIFVNQILRITQYDDTWDRPHTQNEGDKHEVGYVSPTIR